MVATVRLAVGIFTLSCQYFTGDTLVSTEDGDRRIDEIKPGDKVWSYNTETGENELQEVKNVSVSKTDVLVHVLTADGKDIETTMFHPFYVKNEDGTGEWKAASNLEAGDELLTEDGSKVSVVEIRVEKLDEEVTVYNLELGDVHTYYVAGGVLVHNRCKKYESYDDCNIQKNERVGKSRGNTPRDNTRQNKQIKKIAQKLNLNDDELEVLHELISHQGYGFNEILELAREYFER